MKNDKSIEDFMKELDQLEAAGELIDDEPSFQGHTLDLSKWETYQNIKGALESSTFLSFIFRNIWIN